MALARGSATLNAPSGCFFRVFLVNTRNTPPEAPGDDDKQCRQNVERERSGASPRKALALKRRTRPVVAFTPKHCTSRQESAPREVQRGLWLWRAGARRSMPPLVASFGYFLSTQEIPPPEAPGDDDKQCRQNVERERSGASPRKALALKRRTRPVVAFTPKHCTSRQESAPREVQRGLWLWRAGARLSMPPLVASFGYFLSIQEIPPPEAPGSDDKQLRQNVEREQICPPVS